MSGRAAWRPFPSSRLTLTDKPFRAHLQFPSTKWELLAGASPHGDHSAAALNEFAERYYAAVRAFIAAVSRNPVDADDLTQRFFETVVLSGRLLSRADPVKGSFRPYLKQAIRNFIIDEHRRQARSVNPDIRPDGRDEGWNGLADSSPGPDAALLQAWARSLVGMAVARLEALCEANKQQQHFQLFVRRYLVDPDHPPSWREVGEAFGLDEKIARSRAETAVRHFRALLRDLVASDMGSEKGIEEELEAVIAVL
jgi:RNA polymerase sigma factor (sigma-70 family)